MAARLLWGASAAAIFASLPLQSASARDSDAAAASADQPQAAQDAAPVPQSTSAADKAVSNRRLLPNTGAG